MLMPFRLWSVCGEEERSKKDSYDFFSSLFWMRNIVPKNTFYPT
jgi:hypothetical protein